MFRLKFSMYHVIAPNDIRFYLVVRKEGNVLFNDTLNTFYLQFYGIRHMIKDHSDSERENLLLPHATLLH